MPEKDEIATASLKFLGNVFSEHGITPENKKTTKFLAEIRFPHTVKQVKRHCFLHFFRNFIAHLKTKLIPFLKL